MGGHPLGLRSDSVHGAGGGVAGHAWVAAWSCARRGRDPAMFGAQLAHGSAAERTLSRAGLQSLEPGALHQRTGAGLLWMARYVLLEHQRPLNQQAAGRRARCSPPVPIPKGSSGAEQVELCPPPSQQFAVQSSKLLRPLWGRPRACPGDLPCRCRCQ